MALTDKDFIENLSKSKKPKLDLVFEEWDVAGLPWWFLGNLRSNYKSRSNGSTDIQTNQVCRHLAAVLVLLLLTRALSALFCFLSDRTSTPPLFPILLMTCGSSTSARRIRAAPQSRWKRLTARKQKKVTKRYLFKQPRGVCSTGWPLIHPIEIIGFSSAFWCCADLEEPDL